MDGEGRGGEEGRKDAKRKKRMRKVKGSWSEGQWEQGEEREAEVLEAGWEIKQRTEAQRRNKLNLRRSP